MMISDIEKEMLSKALKETYGNDFEELKKSLPNEKEEEFYQRIRNSKKYKKGKRYCIEKMNLREYSKKQLIRIIYDLQEENDELTDLLEVLE